MTVLAFDGRYVAIDSQVTSGDTKYTARKAWEITTPEGQELVVFGCGTWADVQLCVACLREGRKMPEGDYTLAVWGFSDGLVEFCGSDAASQVAYDHYAAGSGAQAALGALKMGASAAKAAAIACEVNTYCDGPVVVYDTKTGRFRGPRASR